MPARLEPLKQLVHSVGEILAMLIPILIALALVAFFWGLVRYIFGGAEKAADGRKIMVSGLIALFVMVTVYGIIRLAQGALGIDSNPNIQVPNFPGR